jgi:hypothetical protein
MCKNKISYSYNIKSIVSWVVFIFFWVTNSNANPLACAVCSIAIAGGLGVAKMLGVDETAVGVWCGAFLFVLAQWTITYLAKKNIKKWWISSLSYLLWFSAIIPLYIGENPSIIFNLNTILGVDAFLVSIVFGTLTLICSIKLYQYMKEKNKKPHFPFEKVALPIFSLIVESILFNLFMN